MPYIILYLVAIVAANLLVARFGPSISVVTAFFLIGFDLVSRDALHDRWHGQHLRRNMLLLIGAGSAIAFLLNTSSLRIGVASFAAFAIAGIADTATYQRLFHRHPLLRMNGSNAPAAIIDSILFPLIAFGWPPLFGIMAGQAIAKIAGGALWSFVVYRVRSMTHDPTP